MFFKIFLVFLCTTGILTFAKEESTKDLKSQASLREQISNGDQLTWMFHKTDTDIYYLTNKSHAVDTYLTRRRFNFTLKEGADISSIRYSDDTFGVWIGSDDLLVSTTYPSYFLFEFIDNTTNRFRIYDNSTKEPIVTPMATPPFKFYRQRRYPNEPPAIFSVDYYVLDNEDIAYNYGGLIQNIVPVADVIKKLTNVNKTEAYSVLLDLMQEFGHLNGSDIFYVAANIVKDLGPGDSAFLKLPKVVQLLFEKQSFNFSIDYYREVYPMKYYWASGSHDNILPYTFTFNNLKSKLWAITYGEEHQLITRANNLEEEVQSKLQFLFEFKLNPDLSSIVIRCGNYGSTSNYKLNPKLVEKDLYFICTTAPLEPYGFLIQEYLEN